MSGAFPDRVLQRVVGQIGVGQAEFCAVVDEYRTGKREFDERHRPCPRSAQLDVGVGRRLGFRCLGFWCLAVRSVAVRSVAVRCFAVGSLAVGDRTGQTVAGHLTVDVVIRQRPGRCSADAVHGVEGVLDRIADGVCVERCLGESEIEAQMQLVGAEVLRESLVVVDPDLADVRGTGVVVDDRADLSVDVVDRVVVEPRVVVTVDQEARSLDIHVGKIRGFGHAVCDVDAEAVDAAVEPEAQCLLEVVEDLGVLPVQVGLLAREDVEVPLPGRAVGLGDTVPRGSAEDADPVVRRLVAVLAPPVTEDVPRTFGTARSGRQCVDEPLVLVAGVVGDEVHGHADLAVVRLDDQFVERRQIAEERIDIARVRDVVTVVGHGGAHDRAQPQRVDAEQFEVAELVDDTGEVADAVAVEIGERPRIDLVEDRRTPPGVVGRVELGRYRCDSFCLKDPVGLNDAVSLDDVLVVGAECVVVEVVGCLVAHRDNSALPVFSRRRPGGIGASCPICRIDAGEIRRVN